MKLNIAHDHPGQYFVMVCSAMTRGGLHTEPQLVDSYCSNESESTEHAVSFT